MKLVTYDAGMGPRVGGISAAGIVDLVSAARGKGADLPGTMQGLIEGGAPALATARAILQGHTGDALAPEGVRLHSPIPRPVRFRDACLFLEHLEKAYGMIGREFDPQFKKQIIYYNGDNVHVFGSGDTVPWPRDSQEADYELEWAVVIGKGGANIARENAAEHIFGYTILNDWSARDLQMPFMACGLGPGAGKDFANSFGPCIATADSIPDPYALTMTAQVNGEIWSQGSTGTMHWSFEDAIAKLSLDRPLVPGEMIGSGTVLNGCGLEIGKRLADGDVVELEVEGIGTLRNTVRFTAAA